MFNITTHGTFIATGIILLMSIFAFRRPVLRGTNLLIFYWIFMVFIGSIVSYLSEGLFYKESYYQKTSAALALYVIGFAFFSLSFVSMRLAAPRHQSVASFAPSCRPPITMWLPTAMIIGSALGLALTWMKTGSVPILQYDNAAEKYFVETSAVYVKFRPIYTLSMLILSATATFLLSNALDRRPRLFHICLIILVVCLLAATGKRGQLLTPFLYVSLAVALQKGRLRYFGAGVIFIIFVAGLFGAFGGQDALISWRSTIIHSFFVGVRELSLLLAVFDGKFLYGKTYLAGILGFIPTEYFALKEEFLFGRYTRILLGQDPNLAGGIRASYLGEAYINFGFLGVIIISYIFGLCAYVFESKILRSSIVRRSGLAGVAFYFLVVHKGLLAFFEDGSNMVLHLMIPAIIYLTLLHFSVYRHRSVAT